MRLPRPPKAGVEFDFRQTPTRISARQTAEGYELYEAQVWPERKDRMILLRPDWLTIYETGRILADLED